MTRLLPSSGPSLATSGSGRMVAMMDTPRLGFIGLGIMGRPMAGHLLDAGYPLVVTTRTPSTADELLARGAAWAATAAEIAGATDVVITMLPDTPDVEAVVGGPDGIRAGARDGQVVIDMSTIDPPTTRRLAAALMDH